MPASFFEQGKATGLEPEHHCLMVVSVYAPMLAHASGGIIFAYENDLPEPRAIG